MAETERRKDSNNHVYMKRAEECKTCNDLKRKEDELPLLADTFTYLDVPVTLVNTEKCDKSTEVTESRRQFILELRICVSALQNSFGGAVLIHINGKKQHDDCLDYFHDLVDKHLNSLIADGKLFVQCFRKYPIDKSRQEFVAILVEPSSKLVTVDFKTKTPLDCGTTDTSRREIRSLMATEPKNSIYKIILRGLQTLQTSRCLQLKSFNTNEQHDVNVLAELVWSKCKLGQYISSFSKLDGGGSLLLGICEMTSDYKEYKSKIFSVDGVNLSMDLHEKFLEKLGKLAKSELFVYQYDSSQHIDIEDFTKFQFYDVSGNGKFVLEIAVAAVKGLVFYDKNGPLAFAMDDENCLKRIPFVEWQHRFLKN